MFNLILHVILECFYRESITELDSRYRHSGMTLHVQSIGDVDG